MNGKIVDNDTTAIHPMTAMTIAVIICVYFSYCFFKLSVKSTELCVVAGAFMTDAGAAFAVDPTLAIATVAAV